MDASFIRKNKRAMTHKLCGNASDGPVLGGATLTPPGVDFFFFCEGSRPWARAVEE